jgi:hypothetical protein
LNFAALATGAAAGLATLGARRAAPVTAHA